MKKPEPERRCIASGDTEPRSGLIRFVVGPEKEIVPDIWGKLPGRGIWVSSDRAALEKAISKGLFSRAAKEAVKVPDGLFDVVDSNLMRRVTDCLSLARKAGLAVAGYEKVKSLLIADEAKALFQASDGAEGSKKKLRAPQGEAAYVDCLTADELGLAFGRDRVIHAAIKPGGLTKICLSEATRLSGLRRSNDYTGKRGRSLERLGQE